MTEVAFQLNKKPMWRVNFKKLLLAVVAAAGLALPALGDVTLKQTTGGKGLGMSVKGTGTTYINGNKPSRTRLRRKRAS